VKKKWQWLKSLFSKPQTYLRYREYPLFAELGSYDLYLLEDRMHERKFKASETIFETGYPLEVIYFIRSGDIELIGVYCSEKEKTISHPQHLGMLDMYHGQGRSSTAIAKTPVVMDAISSSDLMEFIKARPRCGIKILEAACKDFSDFIFEKAQES
jgi:CRP-like cAMP-binding protein